MKIKIIPIGVLGTNCYVLSDELTHKTVVIDPGSKSEHLVQYLENNHLVVTHIIITHGHFDHVGGVSWLITELNQRNQTTQVVMSKAEKSIMEQKSDRKYHKLFFEADKDVMDGEIIDFGFVQLKALLVPGHTNYSMCFYSAENSCVFVGDTLFYHSIGTEAYYDGPAEDLSRNIQSILFALPPETTVYPGHKRETTIEEEIKNNPYLSEADTVDPWL